MRRKAPDYGRESVQLLATAGVLTFGFLGSVFVIVAAVRDPLLPIAVALGVFLLFPMMLLMFRDRPRNSGLRTWFKARTPPEQPPDYSPRRVRTSRETAGSNTPPSAAQIHEIKETSANTWVPTTVPKQAQRKDRSWK